MRWKRTSPEEKDAIDQRAEMTRQLRAAEVALLRIQNQELRDLLYEEKNLMLHRIKHVRRWNGKSYAAREFEIRALAAVLAVMVLVIAGCVSKSNAPVAPVPVKAAFMMPPMALAPHKIFYCTNCPAKPIGGEWDSDTNPVPYQVIITQEMELSNGEVQITAAAEFPGPRTYTLMKNTGGKWYPVISSDTPRTTPQTTDSEGLLLVDDTMTNQNAIYCIRAQ